MRVCNNCRQKECEYRNKGFEEVTLYCERHCAANFKKQCDEIVTEEFRSVIESLTSAKYKNNSAVNGILTQAKCILNVADNKIVSI